MRPWATCALASQDRPAGPSSERDRHRSRRGKHVSSAPQGRSAQKYGGLEVACPSHGSPRAGWGNIYSFPGDEAGYLTPPPSCRVLWGEGWGLSSVLGLRQVPCPALPELGGQTQLVLDLVFNIVGGTLWKVQSRVTPEGSEHVPRSAPAGEGRPRRPPRRQVC